MHAPHMPVAPHVSPQSPRYARLVHLCQAYTCLFYHTSGSTHGHHDCGLPLSTIAHISGSPTKGTIPLPVGKRSMGMSSSLPFTPAHQSNPLVLPLSPHISLRLQGLALSPLGIHRLSRPLSKLDHSSTLLSPCSQSRQSLHMSNCGYV